VLLTVGCGGGSGGTGSSSQGSGAKPLKQWAAQFCTGTVAWVNSLKGASSAVTTQTAASAGDVTALKDMLIKLLNDSMTATDNLIGQLQASGAPDMPNGEKIQTSVVSAFRSGRQVLADALAKAQASSTSDPTGFADTASQVSSSITSGFDAVGKAFTEADKLDPGKALEKAAKSEPACKALNA
jgi:hypothetical protein